MRLSWLTALWIISCGLAACSSAPAVTPSLPAVAAASPTLPTLSLEAPPPITLTPTTTPGIVSPTPSSQSTPVVSHTPTLLTPISRANLTGLAPIHKFDLSPWGLVYAAAWSPDNHKLAFSAGNTVYLVDAHTWRELQRWESHSATGSLAFSPDGQHLAAGSRDGQVRIWDVDTGRLVQAIAAHKKGVNKVVFSPRGGLLASGGNDGMARVWDVQTGDAIAQLIGGSFAIPSLAFTQGGDHLAIVNGDIIRIRDVASGRFVQTIRSPDGIYSLAADPQGSRFAAGGVNGSVRVWDASSAEMAAEFHAAAQPNLVWSVVFSPDGSLLFSSGTDELIHAWDTATGESLLEIAAHTGSVTSLSINPDGRLLATGSLDGNLIVWGIRSSRGHSSDTDAPALAWHT